MQTLLDKIEANAAARLPLPPGRMPAQELARYKAFKQRHPARKPLYYPRRDRWTPLPAEFLLR